MKPNYRISAKDVVAFNVKTDHEIHAESLGDMAKLLNCKHWDVSRACRKGKIINGYQVKYGEDDKPWLTEIVVEEKTAFYLVKDLRDNTDKKLENIYELSTYLEMDESVIYRGLRKGYVRPFFLIKKNTDVSTWVVLRKKMISEHNVNSGRPIKVTDNKGKVRIYKSLKEAAEALNTYSTKLKYSMDKRDNTFNGMKIEYFTCPLDIEYKL